jgi:predicted nucleic acid-binding protein
MPAKDAQESRRGDKFTALAMDLADATLVCLADRNGLDDVFTLDKHFRAYRTRRPRAFRVVP